MTEYKPEFLRLLRLVSLGMAVEPDAHGVEVDTKGAEDMLVEADRWWPWCMGGCR